MPDVELRIDVPVVQPIIDALLQVPAAARAGVLDALNTLRDLVRGRTPVGAPNRPTSGHLKDSWSNVEFLGGGLSFSGEFGTDVEYADTLERGLYPRVGPRTVASEGGIYSRQAPGGIIAPIAGDQQKIDMVIDLVLAQIIRGIESVRA